MKTKILFLTTSMVLLLGCNNERESKKAGALEKADRNIEKSMANDGLPHKESVRGADSPVSSETLKNDLVDHEALATLSFNSLCNEYKNDLESFNKLYNEAETTESRQEIYAESYPRSEQYAERFLKIYDEHPGTASAVKALRWVAGNVQKPELREQAISTLFANHINDEANKNLIVSMVYSEPCQFVEDTLGRVSTSSANRSLRGVATFALANYMNEVAGAKKLIMEQYGGIKPAEISGDTFTYLYNSNFSENDILAQYRLVIEKYADISVDGYASGIGELAERVVYAKEHLSIGKIAPDIAGQDLEGVPFRLSDYRGKVVVLDFWGDW